WRSSSHLAAWCAHALTGDWAGSLVASKYERVLEDKLLQLGVPFYNEEALRQQGRSRTPDVLLLSPIRTCVRVCVRACPCGFAPSDAPGGALDRRARPPRPLDRQQGDVRRS